MRTVLVRMYNLLKVSPFYTRNELFKHFVGKLISSFVTRRYSTILNKTLPNKPTQKCPKRQFRVDIPSLRKGSFKNDRPRACQDGSLSSDVAVIDRSQKKRPFERNETKRQPMKMKSQISAINGLCQKSNVGRETCISNIASIIDADGMKERVKLEKSLRKERRPKKREHIIAALENLNRKEGRIMTVSGIVRGRKKEKDWRIEEKDIMVKNIKEKGNLDFIEINEIEVKRIDKETEIPRIILGDKSFEHSTEDQKLEELLEQHPTSETKMNGGEYKVVKKEIDRENEMENGINQEKSYSLEDEFLFNSEVNIGTVDPKIIVESFSLSEGSIPTVCENQMRQECECLFKMIIALQLHLFSRIITIKKSNF